MLYIFYGVRHYTAEKQTENTLLTNLIRTGTIVESRAVNGKMMARVDVHGRVTDWMPVIGISNAFMKIYIPILVGEQVTVLCEFGEADNGIILRSLFSQDSAEPTGMNATTASILFHDGAKAQYDSSTGRMDVEAIGSIHMTAPHVELVCDTAHMTGTLEIDGALGVGGDISTDGGITDANGDLSNFTTSDGASRA